MLLLLEIFSVVKGETLTQRPVPEQLADIETTFAKGTPYIAAYGIRKLVAAHGHKTEIIPTLEGIIERRRQGDVSEEPQDSALCLLEKAWDKEQRRLAGVTRRNPPSAIDTLFSLAMSGYFAPPPVTPLQHAQQAVLDGLCESVKAHREEPQMVSITRTLLDQIAKDEPRRTREAAEAILGNLTPKFMGLGFCMDAPQDDLPGSLNRQFIATDPLRRTLKARYLAP